MRRLDPSHYNIMMAGVPTLSPSCRQSLQFHVLEPRFDGERTIALQYEIHDPNGTVLATFHETVELPGPPAKAYDQRIFDGLLRALALSASTSYYKTYIPSTIVVASGLTHAERGFLSSVIGHGLAEFAYRNNVPEALAPAISAPERTATECATTHAEPTRILVAVGGGKDSIVSIESLRSLPVEMTLFSVNDYEPIRATVATSGFSLLQASRLLDKDLGEHNRTNALNGHVPVTAINSVVACLTAVRSGFDGVVFSNEASASSGNLSWEGVDVNHQWSKGIEFEAMLQAIIGGSSPVYFSLLRPLTELAIMRRFADLTAYHSIFTSCNRAFHLDPQRRRRWCGECPKCRFVFLCLAPFIPRNSLLKIFSGRDLLADPSQREGFLELLNVGGRLKPFECVGEPEECRAAVTLLAEHYDWMGHPFLDKPEVISAALSADKVDDLFAFRPPHFLSNMYEKAARGVL